MKEKVGSWVGKWRPETPEELRARLVVLRAEALRSEAAGFRARHPGWKKRQEQEDELQKNEKLRVER